MNRGFLHTFFYLLLFSLMLSGAMFGQIKTPVHISASLVPPYTPFLNDYYEQGGNKILTTITLKDMSEPEWDIMLRLRIEGSNGVLLETKPEWMPLNPITITRGFPYQVTADDWANYFNYDNMNISGINLMSFVQNGILPEGMYSFCFEALDYRSGELLSNKACANAMILLGGFPQVIMPNSNFVAPYEPQNINFQWSLTAPALIPANTEYQLRLYEVTSPDVEPEGAIQSGNVSEVFTSEFSMNTMYIYSASEPSLEIGNRYVYTIQVRDREGKSLFKNNGMSDPRWFMYGYPTGGNIVAVLPVNDHSFIKDELQHFKWKIPDNKANLLQKISYYFKIVKLDFKDQDLEDAMKNNPVYYEETTTETTSPNDWEHIVEEAFERQRFFAWKVEAYSGTQMVAESEIRRFQGPPLLEKFRAGDHDVTVLSLENNDLNSLKGVGRIKIDREGNDSLVIPFDSLKIQRAGGIFVLADGTMMLETDKIGITEIPAVIEGQETAIFTPNAVKLDKEMLSIRGEMSLPLDLIVDGKRPRMNTDDMWINYNNFNIRGGISFSATFDLMDPANFTVRLDTNSIMVIGNSGYEVTYYGAVGMPDKTKDLEGNRIFLPFKNLKKLDYIEVDADKDDVVLAGYAPVPNANFTVQPLKFIIDLSETQSPGGLDKYWKGAYISEYKQILAGSVNKNGSISVEDEWVETIQQTSASGRNRNFFTPSGLQFKATMEPDEQVPGKFNTFPSYTTLFEVLIANSSVKEGVYTGTILIPVVDAFRNFNFTSQLSDDGFQDGYLDERLEDMTIYFSKDSETARVEYLIKRAVFADYERLDMTVDITIPALNAKTTNQDNFKVWGNYQIGFGVPNGAIVFDEAITGNLKGVIELFIDTIGACVLNGMYASYSSSILQVTDEIGTPRLHIFSTNDVGAAFDVPNNYSSPPPVEMPITVLNTPPAQVRMVDSLFVELRCPVAEMEGYIAIVENDPDWGNVLKGKLDGFVRLTSKISLGAEIIVGKKQELDYWYFNAYMMDEGVGIPLIPSILNIVGLEGKVYSHMSSEFSEDGKTATMKIDPNLKFGGALFIQLIDQGTSGNLLKADLGLQVKFFSDNDFEIGFRGEATILNAEGRVQGAGGATSGALGEIKDQVIKQAGNVAQMAVDEINNKEIAIGSWKFRPKVVLDPLEGGISAVNGSTEIGFGAKLAGNAMGYFDYKDSDWKVGVASDFHTGLAFRLEKLRNDPFKMGFYFGKEDSVGVDFKYSDYGFMGGYHKKKRTAAFGLDLGEKQFRVFGDYINKAGSISYTQPGFQFDAYANGAKGEGSFLLNANNNRFALMASRSTRMAAITINNNFEFKVDGDKGEGSLALNLGNVEVAVGGSQNSGMLKVKRGSVLIDANANMETKRGQLMLAIDNNNQYGFMIDMNKGAGALNIRTQGTNVAFSASEAAGEGMFDLSLSNGYKIGATANVISKTGSFNLSFDKNNVSTALTTDSVGLFVKSNDISITLGANYQASRGVLGYKMGKDSLRIYADKAGKAAFLFERDKFFVSVAGDKPEGSGSFVYRNGNDSVALNLNKTLGKGTFVAGFKNVNFSAFIDNSGMGGVSYTSLERRINLSGNRAGAGRILYEQAGFLADVSGDKSTGGHLKLKFDYDSISGYYNKSAGTISLASALGDLSVEADLDASGIGTLGAGYGNVFFHGKNNPAGTKMIQFEKENLLISTLLDKNKQHGNMRFVMGSDSISAFLDKSKTIASVAVAYGGEFFSANMEGTSKGGLTYKNAAMEMGLSAEVIGKGMFTYVDNSMAFNILADKPTGNYDLRIKQGNDSIIATVIQEQKIFGAIKNSDVLLQYDISKGDDNFFTYNDGVSDFKMFDKKELRSVSYTNSGDEVFMESQQSGKGEIKIKTGGNTFNIVTNDNNTDKIDIDIEQTRIQSVLVKDGDKTFRFTNGDMVVDVTSTASVSRINMQAGNKQLLIDNQKIFINSGANTLEYKKQPNELWINGEKVEFNPDLSFNFDGWDIIPKFDFNFKGFRIPIPNFPSIDIGFNLDFPSLAFKLGEFPVKFDFNFDGFSFNLGDYNINLGTPWFDFNFGELFSFKIEPLNFDLSFNDLKFFYHNYDDFGFTYRDDFKCNFLLTKVELSYTDKVLSLEPLIEKYGFKWDENKFISGQPNSLNFKYDDVYFDFVKDKNLEFSYQTKKFRLYDKGIQLGWDDKMLDYEVGTSLAAQWDAQKHFSITQTDLKSGWDDYLFNVSMDSVSFAMPKVNLGISEQAFAIGVDGKSLSYDAANRLKFYYEKNKEFTIEPEGFDLNWDKLSASYGSDIPLNLTYDKYKFNLSGYNLSLFLSDYSLVYTFGHHIQFTFPETDVYLSMDELKGKFGNTSMGYNMQKGPWLETGSFSLSSGETEYKLAIGDKVFSYDVEKTQLNLAYGNAWSMSGSPELLGITIAQTSLQISKSTGFKYQDAKNLFELNDDLIIRAGDYTLGIKDFKTNEKNYFVGFDQYELGYTKTAGFKFAYDNKFLSVGGTETFMELALGAYGIKGTTDGAFSLSMGDISILTGGQDLFGFGYKGDKIAMSKRLELSMSSGDKGIQFASDGSITLINGSQRIIAGGTSSIRVVDPDGVSMPHNSGGYSFDVAGIKLDVNPMPGNNVKILANAGFAIFDISTEGQGEMKAGLFAMDKHVATLYKNKYTWGLAFGDEPINTAGPQATETIQMDGPQNIGYITHGSTSVIQMKVFASFSSKTSTFLLNAGASGTRPLLCMNNVALSAKFSPDDWYVKIAEENPRSKWASIQPLCTGLETSGFFYLDDSEVRAGINWRYAKSVETPWIGAPAVFAFKLKAWVDVEIGGKGAIIYRPTFQIPYIEIWLNARAGLDGCGKALGADLGCVTILAIGISGKLRAVFTDYEKSVAGEIEACVTIFGYTACGGMEAKVTFG